MTKLNKTLRINHAPSVKLRLYREYLAVATYIAGFLAESDDPGNRTRLKKGSVVAHVS